MKNILLIFILFFTITSYGQEVNPILTGKAKALDFGIGDNKGLITGFSDQTGYDFTLLSLNEGALIVDQSGSIWQIDTISSRNVLQAAIVISKLYGNSSYPLGTVAVSNVSENFKLPVPATTNSTGITPKQQSEILNYIIQQLDKDANFLFYLEENETVYNINKGDTLEFNLFYDLIVDSISATKVFALDTLQQATNVQVILDGIQNTITGLQEGNADGVATGGVYDAENQKIDISVQSPGSNFSIDLSTLSANGIIDATRLVQDSILIYYQDDVEISRDTIKTQSGGAADGVVISGTYDSVNQEIDFVLGAPGVSFSIDVSQLLDNTNLTEAEVDFFVDNNGYLTSEVDGSVTNEIQDLQSVTNQGATTTNAILFDTPASSTSIQIGQAEKLYIGQGSSPGDFQIRSNSEIGTANFDVDSKASYLLRIGQSDVKDDFSLFRAPANVGGNTSYSELFSVNEDAFNLGVDLTTDYKIGIGTTTPSSALEIEGSNPIFKINATDDTKQSSIFFEGSGTLLGAILQQNLNHPTVDRRGDLEFFVDPDGNDFSIYTNGTTTKQFEIKKTGETIIYGKTFLESVTQDDAETKILVLQNDGEVQYRDVSTITGSSSVTALEVGINPISGIASNNVQGALEENRTAIANLSTGGGTSDGVISDSTTYNNTTQTIDVVINGGVSADFSIDVSALLDDTNLTEAEVDAFVADNGYLTSYTETDPVWTADKPSYATTAYVDANDDTGTDSQTLTIDSTNRVFTLSILNGNEVKFEDTNTQLTETQVDDFVSDNGYLTDYTETDPVWLADKVNYATLTDVSTAEQAAKDYADANDDTGTDDQTALEVNYDNTLSEINATNVQEAIDEIESRVDLNDAKVTNTDDQIITDLSLAGTILSVGLENANSLTLDLASIDTDTDTKLSQDEVLDFAGSMFDTNTENLITSTYDNTTKKTTLTVEDDLSLYDNTTSGFITSSDLVTNNTTAGNIPYWDGDSWEDNITTYDAANNKIIVNGEVVANTLVANNNIVSLGYIISRSTDNTSSALNLLDSEGNDGLNITVSTTGDPNVSNTKISNPTGEILIESVGLKIGGLSQDDTDTRILSFNNIDNVIGFRNVSDLLSNLSINSIQLTEFETDFSAGEIALDEEGVVRIGVTDNYSFAVGQDVYKEVHNTTESLIPQGTALMMTGADGASNVFTVAPMSYPTISSEFLIGIAANDIAVGGFGVAVQNGYVKGIDVNGEGWSEGDVLYLDETSAGGLTTTVGDVLVAAVTKAGSNGSIYVRPDFYATNEIQTLSWSAGTDGNDVVTLSNGGNTITITDDVDDEDADPTNEIQDLSLTNTTLSLSGSAVNVDLSVVQDGYNTNNTTLDYLPYWSGTAWENSGFQNKSDATESMIYTPSSSVLYGFGGIDNEFNRTGPNFGLVGNSWATNTASRGNIWTEFNTTVNELANFTVQSWDGTAPANPHLQINNLGAKFYNSVIFDGISDGSSYTEVLTRNSTDSEVGYVTKDNFLSGYATESYVDANDDVDDADADPANEIQDLQSVTDEGATTTNPVILAGGVTSGTNGGTNGFIKLQSNIGPSATLSATSSGLRINPDPGGGPAGVVSINRQADKNPTTFVLEDATSILMEYEDSGTSGDIVIESGPLTNGSTLTLGANASGPRIVMGRYGLNGNPANLRFNVFNTSTEVEDTKMTLTTNGQLGIGTTTPTTLLDVNGTANVSGALKLGSVTQDDTETNLLVLQSDGEVQYRDVSTISAGTDDQTAAEVDYTNTTSGLTATDVQAAIDEIEARVDLNDAKVTNTDDQSIYNNVSATTLDFATYSAANSDVRNFNFGLTATALTADPDAILNLPADATGYEEYIITVSCDDNGSNACIVNNLVDGTYTMLDGELLVIKAANKDAGVVWFYSSSLGSGLPNPQVLSWSAGLNGDDEITLSDGGGTITITDNVDDADADPTNEIQSILLGEDDLLLISGSPSSNSADLSKYLDNTDAQTLGVSGDDITLTNGGSVSVINTVVSTASLTVDLESSRNRVVQIDMTSAGGTPTLSVSYPVSGGVYTFHFQNTTNHDINFPANFLKADGTTWDGGSTVNYSADDWLTCYYDGTNFYCK